MRHMPARIVLLLVVLGTLAQGTAHRFLPDTPVVRAQGALLVLPAQGPPGTQIAVTASSGLLPGNTTQLVMFRDPNGSTITTLGQVQTATNGAFSLLLRIPAASSGGSGAVYLQGYPSISATFAVQPTLVVMPAAAVPGATVTITGTGYRALTPIILSLDGSVLPLQPAPVTDLFGTFSALIALPLTLSGGGHTLNAGDSTPASAQTVASIEVLAPTATPELSATPASTPTATGTPAANVPVPFGTPGPALGNGPTVAYFAEGDTSTAAITGKVSFFEAINILNPGTTPASIAITYYLAGGGIPVAVSRVVAPQSTLQEQVAADVGAGQIVSAMVTSPQRVYVSRSIARFSAAGLRLDGSLTTAAVALSTHWDFAEGYTGVTFQEYLALFNPSSTPASVQITLAPQTGTAAGAPSFTLAVPAQSRVTANIRALNHGSAESIGLLVRSTVPIDAERILYFGDGSGSAKFGSTVSQGLTTAATDLIVPFGLAGGAAGTGDQEFLTLLNPGSEPATVTVQVIGSTGPLAGVPPATYTVPSGTRRTVPVYRLVGSGGPYAVVLHATAPIEAEAAQYFAGSPNIGSHPGVAMPAVSSVAGTAYLTDLGSEPGPTISVSRQIYLYNPGPATIQVQVHYFTAGGPTAAHLYAVPAGGLSVVNVNQDLQNSMPIGEIGAELQVLSGGGFAAVSIGRTADGFSALAEPAIAAY